MSSHPKIKIKRSKSDWVLEILSYLLLMIFWIVIIVSFKYLPAEIPTHYNGRGQADAFGDKETIFMLPVIATLLFILLTVVGNYPHTFNYAVEITKENAEKQYKNAVWLMRILRVLITLIFFLDRKSTRLNSSHVRISYAVFCLKKKKINVQYI